MIRASWDSLSSPPPSRTDNAILPQGSAESYKKGGSLSQGFSLALPPAAWLASNGRGAPARQGGDVMQGHAEILKPLVPAKRE